MSDDLTEFSFLDTQEMHLVGLAANGFESPLVAKSQQKGKTMSKPYVQTSKVDDVLEAALSPLVKEVKRAEKAIENGDTSIRARTDRRDANMRLCFAKMFLAENARQSNPQRYRSKFPNGVQIIVNKRELPDDPTIFGVSRGVPVAR